MIERGTEARARRGAPRGAADERTKAVDAAILAIEKQFGRGSIMRLGSSERAQVDVIPTGSIALDLALGVGGIPRGRITEIFGPESSGKTTLCQHILAEAQRKGGVVAFIDVEHALDPGYARACGVNVDELLVSQPDTGEDALQITETLIRSGGVDCRGGGLRRRARAQGRDRRRDGRLVRRHPGPPDEPGPAQARRRRSAARTRPSSSPTSCARRSA